MPKVYNPDTQDAKDVSGNEVKQAKDDGYIVVGQRPESEWRGKTREELKDDDDVDTNDSEASEEPGAALGGEN